MTKKTTNLLGILITILAGTYFSLIYCAPCNSDSGDGLVSTTVSETTHILATCTRLSGMALILTGRLLTEEHSLTNGDSEHTHTNQP